MSNEHISTSAASIEPHFIIDVDHTDKLPKKFRMTTAAIPSNVSELPDLKGLSQLRASGGGQFSLGGLRSMKREIGEEPIIIVDLRQESHGFVNGLAVSWYGPHNDSNKGLADEAVAAREAELLEEIARAELVVFDQLAGKSVDIGRTIANPKLVQTEEELVRSEGLDYKRFFVTDHHRPLDAVVDQFVEWALALPEGKWLHFHCRGGVGRTSSFLNMYDMMKHAGDVSLEHIMQRHVLIGGKNFDALDPSDTFKYGPALERIAFIRNFYSYCVDQRPLSFLTSWSEWMASRAE